MNLLTDTTVYSTQLSHRPGLPRHVYWLSGALAITGGFAAALTFLLPEVLSGPPVTNGNARGTALVMFALAIPTMSVAMWFAARGSWRAIFIWLGALFYLGYNAFLLLFLTPFNRLFLVYVATQSLAIFAAFSLILACDRRWLMSGMRRPPFRGLAVFVWAIVALNTVAWLGVVFPAVIADDPMSFLEGTGVATNAIYVQDLVLWLPLMALAAWWLWTERSIGILLTGSWLLFGIFESIGIGVDQWFGHRADPASPLASEAVIPFMAILAMVNAVGVYFYLRSSPTTRLTRRQHDTPTAGRCR